MREVTIDDGGHWIWTALHRWGLVDTTTFDDLVIISRFYMLGRTR